MEYHDVPRSDLQTAKQGSSTFNNGYSVLRIQGKMQCIFSSLGAASHVLVVLKFCTNLKCWLCLIFSQIYKSYHMVLFL